MKLTSTDIEKVNKTSKPIQDKKNWKTKEIEDIRKATRIRLASMESARRAKEYQHKKKKEKLELE